jgi:hypothetical protein
MEERGAGESEVFETVITGERFAAKYGRTGFRQVFSIPDSDPRDSRGKKLLEVFTVEGEGDMIVITVVVKYF